MKTNGLLIIFLALLLVGCTMPWARDTESTRGVVATPDVTSRPTSQLPNDRDAVPPLPTQEPGYREAQHTIERAIADLQALLGADAEHVVVQEVLPAEFPDASLGVPEAGVTYAQVVTPGYVIRLAVGDKVYEYHGNDQRIVLVPEADDGFPALTVDESPIVAAEIDGPGHFEYTDRLSEGILTRLEGLRTRAAEQELARANAALAPFGYRLEERFDAEWNRTFHDLYRENEAEPMLAGLSHVWPVSVNASGTDFIFAAENAPNVFPLYLQLQAGSVEPWDADQNAYLPPAYVGDALARVTFTGFPTLTYQVELDGQAVYSGTAVALGAYMPLRSLTTWDGHWVLEVDDRLIMDGQDIGQGPGYDAAFGFSLIHGRPFYFFEREGQVRISYGGRALPHVYDQVFHNRCCEAAIHNVEVLGDVILFHALSNGTWYFVEAGLYDGEMAGTHRYTAPEGWSFRYPMHWDRLDEEVGFVQETATGKTVTFASQPTTQAELERWIESEIDRKLAATEAGNTLLEPLTVVQKGDLTVYRYAILSRRESLATALRTTVLFDGQRRYEFWTAVPPVADEEYEAILASFVPVSAP
jgi:hypothetical protein